MAVREGDFFLRNGQNAYPHHRHISYSDKREYPLAIKALAIFSLFLKLESLSGMKVYRGKGKVFL